MNRESLLDSIRRLLALSASPNEHEARSALAKAQELMLRHNIAMADVEAAGRPSDRWTDRPVHQAGRNKPAWLAPLSQVVARFFFVEIWNRRERHLDGRFVNRTFVFGEPTNVEIARYVFGFLAEVFPDLWRRHARATGSPRRLAVEYYLGLSEGLAAKLTRDRQAAARDGGSGALVLLQRQLTQRFGETHPALRKQHRCLKVGGTFFDGLSAGRQIEVRRAISDRHSSFRIHNSLCALAPWREMV